MKKTLIFIAIITIILFISFCFSTPKKREIVVKDRVFEIEIADNPQSRYTGLSSREKLGKDQAMLFVFPKKENYSFVMRDMNFPLDIIFIADGKIVDIKHNLPPENSAPRNIYHSSVPSDQVLEINGGLSSIYNFIIGDQVLVKEKNGRNCCLSFKNMLKLK